jgi:hypothetical protein
MTDHDPDYTPEVVADHLLHWAQLEVAVEGATGPNYQGSRGGRHGRETLVAIKADLERAADSLPLHWQQTARIFRLQRRWQVYLARRAQAGLPAGTSDGLGFDGCCTLMARALGWTADEGRKVA